MRTIDWYFDFISPYSYLGLLTLNDLGPDVDVRYRPVLFAELLNRTGSKGPAEIPAKRTWTYRWCTWWAAERGIPFRLPAAHPFNPLPYLRLAIAADCSLAAIRRIFESLWTTAADPASEDVLHALMRELGIEPAAMDDPAVKLRLRENTAEAVARGVFGVPTYVVDDQLFWGADSVGFLKAYLADRGVLSSEEMRRIESLPQAAVRKPKSA